MPRWEYWLPPTLVHTPHSHQSGRWYRRLCMPLIDRRVTVINLHWMLDLYVFSHLYLLTKCSLLLLAFAFFNWSVQLQLPGDFYVLIFTSWYSFLSLCRVDAGLVMDDNGSYPVPALVVATVTQGRRPVLGANATALIVPPPTTSPVYSTLPPTAIRLRDDGLGE